jgi:Contractile injection system tube protein
MSESFPGSPRLQRGSIIAIDQTTRLPTEITFQYNPDTLTRRVTAQSAQGDSGTGVDRNDALRLQGPPQETISLELEIDATDQLANADPSALSTGIYPALAAFESLLYPGFAQVAANEVLARFGLLEVIPLEAPLTMFVWGRKRTLPVRLTSFTITEESFDPQLNPIRAKISLEMQVLTYNDLGFASIGGAAYISHHLNIEQWAIQHALGISKP